MSDPLLILAGIPSRTTAQRGTFTFLRPGWGFQRCDATGKDPDLGRCWNSVMHVIDEHIKANDSSVHLLAFHKSTRNTRPPSVYEAQVRPYHRVLFLPLQLLSLYGSPDFDTAINEYVAFEEKWRILVMPRSHEEPLLLPQTHFLPPKAFHAMWGEAAACSGDEQRLIMLNKTIEAFRQQLRRNIGWQLGYIDSNDRIFVYNGALHGVPEKLSERWKSNYQMEPGFHYDVQGTEDGMVMHFADGGGSSLRRKFSVRLRPNGLRV